MKKTLILLLALVLLLTLTACGGKKDAGTDGNAQNAGDQNAEPQNSQSQKSQRPAGTSFTEDYDIASRISDQAITNIQMGKDTYKVGETITVLVEWKGTPDESAWIGIIPAEVDHGDELVNDEYDLDYRYFTEMSSGDTFVFEGIELEPGKYTMRVNETDGGGAELASVEFIVK